MAAKKSNPMSIKTFLAAARVLEPKYSLLLCADHGLGKSQVIRQLRVLHLQDDEEQKALGRFPLIDRRLSQMSEGDMLGLPSTDGEVTRFNPPAWYRRACKEPCYLFLDELNRATPEVMQAAFQIVLDRELNGWALHPLTRVAAAVNTGASYTVNEIDPALGDRFWRSDLDPTLEDWLDWAKGDCIDPDSPKFGSQNCHPVVFEFIRTNKRWLDTPHSASPGECHPSRRSWERVSDALVAAGIADDASHPLFYVLTMGFVGTEAAIAFHGFAKNFDNRISGKEILDGYHKKAVKAKVGRQGNEGLNSCIEKVADHVSTLDKLAQRQGKNLAAFMEILPGELRIAFWARLTKGGIEKMQLANDIHAHCGKLLLDVFGIPMGPAGIGIMPNIPGMFDEEMKDKKGGL